MLRFKQNQIQYFFSFLATLFLSNIVIGQNLVGLYGECDEKISGYVCQQVLLDTNNQFQFYDYLHLNGKIINKGHWSQSGDTIILNSDNLPKIVFERKNNTDSEITICIIDTTNNPYFFGWMLINSDTIPTEFNYTNCVTIPNRQINKLSINVSPKNFILNFTNEEMENISKITIYYKEDELSSFVFKDEKWLVSKNKLFHTKLPSGEFDHEKSFKLTKMKNKRF